MGAFTPNSSPDGSVEVPIISNVGGAINSLSLWSGAVNVEISRVGVEAVPESTREASEAIGVTRLQSFAYVVLLLPLRASIPVPNNNLVSLAITATQTFVIAVPDWPKTTALSF